LVTNHPGVLVVDPCHRGMARPRIAGGGDGLRMLKIAANTLNKQSWTTDKGVVLQLRFGWGANNSSP